MDDDVHVVIMFYVVETYVSWEVGFGREVVGGSQKMGRRGERGNLGGGK